MPVFSWSFNLIIFTSIKNTGTVSAAHDVPHMVYGALCMDKCGVWGMWYVITRCDLLTLSFDVTEFVIFQQYFGDL